MNKPETIEIEKWVDLIDNPKFRDNLIISANDFYKIFGKPGGRDLESGIKEINSKYSEFYESALFNLDWSGIGPGELALSYIFNSKLSGSKDSYDFLINNQKIEVKKVNSNGEFYLGKEAAINTVPLWASLLEQVPVITGIVEKVFKEKTEKDLKENEDLQTLFHIFNKFKKTLKDEEAINTEGLSEDEINRLDNSTVENAFYKGEFTKAANIKLLTKIFLASNNYMSSKESSSANGVYDYVRFVSSNYATKPATYRINKIGISDLAQNSINLDLQYDIKNHNNIIESVHNLLMVQLLKMKYAMYPHLIYNDYIESENKLIKKLSKKRFILLSKTGLTISNSDNLKIVKVSRNSLGVRIGDRLPSDLFSIMMGEIKHFLTIKSHTDKANYTISGSDPTSYEVQELKENRTNESKRLKRFNNF